MLEYQIRSEMCRCGERTEKKVCTKRIARSETQHFEYLILSRGIVTFFCWAPRIQSQRSPNHQIPQPSLSILISPNHAPRSPSLHHKIHDGTSDTSLLPLPCHHLDGRRSLFHRPCQRLDYGLKTGIYTSFLA